MNEAGKTATVDYNFAATVDYNFNYPLMSELRSCVNVEVATWAPVPNKRQNHQHNDVGRFTEEVSVDVKQHSTNF